MSPSPIIDPSIVKSRLINPDEPTDRISFSIDGPVTERDSREEIVVSLST